VKLLLPVRGAVQAVKLLLPLLLRLLLLLLLLAAAMETCHSIRFYHPPLE